MFIRKAVQFLVGQTSAKIGEIVGQFEREDLVKLKAECGGLQTLLKNYKQLFVVEGGTFC